MNGVHSHTSTAITDGAAYVPIEPTYPPERQEFMLADARAPVLITQERYLGAVDLRGTKVLCVDRDGARVNEQSGDPLPQGADPEQLAYVIYTSGSTGAPKGVEIAEPILTQIWLDVPASATFAHTLIIAEELSSVRYVNEYNSSVAGEQPAFLNDVVEVFAGNAAASSSAQRPCSTCPPRPRRSANTAGTICTR